MRAYITRRLLYMVVMLFMASLVSFLVITLPPGDYMTSYIARLKSQGQDVGEEQAAALRRQYGLDYPLYVQYLKWMGLVFQGKLGRSFEWNKPVTQVIEKAREHLFRLAHRVWIPEELFRRSVPAGQPLNVCVAPIALPPMGVDPCQAVHKHLAMSSGWRQWRLGLEMRLRQVLE